MSTNRDRILRGGAALTLRQALSLPLNAAGLGAASLWLVPADFGVLAILLVLTNFAFAVVDLGFTNALIQSSSTPSRRILHRIQWYKLSAGVASTLLYALLARVIASHYALPATYLVLFPACGPIAWLQSQRGHQSIWLQRTIDWQRLAAVEIAEIAVYNVCLAATAYLLRSPSCFLLAMGTRMLLGAVVLKLMPVHIPEASTLKRGSIRELLRFGVPYQATTVLSMIQKSLNPVIVGTVAGVNAVGVVNWSTYVASMPLVPLQPMYGFLFSILSERQRQQRDSGEIIQAILRIGSMGGTFLSLCAALLLPAVAHRFLGQWTSAVPIACLFLVANSIAVPSSVLTTYLTARGFSNAWMRIVIVETGLIWVLGVAGLLVSGVIGYAVGLMAAGTIVLAIDRVVTKRLTGVPAGLHDTFGAALMAIVSMSVAVVAWHFGPGTGRIGQVVPPVLGCATFCALTYFDVVRGFRKDLETLWVSAVMIYRGRVVQPRAKDG